jgi:hypothetical protein
MSKNTPGNQKSLKWCIYAVNKASNNKAIFKQEEGRDTDETKYTKLLGGPSLPKIMHSLDRCPLECLA